MAESGGTSITTMPDLQSLSQARDRSSNHAASAIWDASIVKIILGGRGTHRHTGGLSIGENFMLPSSATFSSSQTHQRQPKSI